MIIKIPLPEKVSTWSDERRLKQSILMKELGQKGLLNRKGNPRTKPEIPCSFCGKPFYHITNRKTCSDYCASEFMKNQWSIKEHPRGMLGKRHNDGTKLKKSISSKKMWRNPKSKVNSTEHRQMLSNRNVRFHRNGILGGVNAYSHAKRGWWVKGEKKYYMRSGWELVYANYLEFIKEKGQIHDWEYEADTFWFENIKRGVRSYKPDFKVYSTKNDFVYYEIKGYMDAKSKTKIKRMAKYHPSVKLIVIEKDEYMKVKKFERMFKDYSQKGTRDMVEIIIT